MVQSNLVSKETTLNVASDRAYTTSHLPVVDSRVVPAAKVARIFGAKKRKILV
jgi:hypothetical protein